MSGDNSTDPPGIGGGSSPRNPAAAAAGWYPDPWAGSQRRFWDGDTWTAAVFPDRTAGEHAGVAARLGRPSPFQDRVVDGHSATAPPAPNWTVPTPALLDPARGIVRLPAPAAPKSPRSRTALVIAVSLTVAFALVLVLIFAFLLPGSASTDAASTPSASSLLPSPSPTVSSTSPQPTQAPSGGATTPVPGGTGQPGTGAQTPADPQAEALQNLGLRQSDVVKSVTVATIAGGDQVSQHPTLDLCNATYSSEALRTARHQVAATDPVGNGLLSTEAVLYQNESAAKLALAQLRLEAARCPATPVANPTTGQPQTTTMAPAPDKTWPAVATVTRQAYAFTSTDPAGMRQANVAVYLQRGRVLLAVYFFQPAGEQPSVANQRSIQRITAVFEKRLAALPASVVANP